MGSSLSPVLSNIYTEHFEEYLLEDIPVAMRPVLWLRYVDDVFCCYEDMSMFDAFLERLNSLRPSIKFTFELSRMSDTTNGSPELPANVSECLPFLELNVMRLSDGNFAFSIYRKPVHAGNYLHAYSYQPLFQKETVIRSLYLRAYRYCDKQFLQKEEQQVRQDFLHLGYTEKFIEKCRVSTYRGHSNEIKKENLLALQELPFASTSVALTEKQEPRATLKMSYHPSMMKLRPQLTQMGIRLAFTSNSTIRQQLQRRAPSCKPPRGSVYVINCSGCSDVYIGQTGKIVEGRMDEHARGPQGIAWGAVHKHNA